MYELLLQLIFYSVLLMLYVIGYYCSSVFCIVLYFIPNQRYFEKNIECLRLSVMEVLFSG